MVTENMNDKILHFATFTEYHFSHENDSESVQESVTNMPMDMTLGERKKVLFYCSL